MMYRLIFVLCVVSNVMFAQNLAVVEDSFTCEVHKVLPPLSIERATLDEANTIDDIHRQYKPEWVREFIAVEIQTIHNGQKKVITSTNDELTEAQLDNLKTCDMGSDIYIKIDYMPNNNLKHNEAKTYDCTFKINPDQDAKYTLGDLELSRYLKKNVTDKISNNTITGYALAAVKFTVDNTGHINDVQIVESSKDTATDKLLHQAICDMKQWAPAEFKDGTTTTQEFVLTVGSMQSCIVPTLNIKRY